MLVALVVSYAMTRHIAIMPLVTAVIVLIFGSLTLILHNDTFIKLKPTIIYVLFGGTLVGGLMFGKSFLGIMFDSVFDLTDEGWRKLTWRWAFFFFALAVLNEIVWRNFSTDVWVSFKLFGVVPLTFLFGALQYPLLMKYSGGKEELTRGRRPQSLLEVDRRRFMRQRGAYRVDGAEILGALAAGLSALPRLAGDAHGLGRDLGTSMGAVAGVVLQRLRRAGFPLRQDLSRRFRGEAAR